MIVKTPEMIARRPYVYRMKSSTASRSSAFDLARTVVFAATTAFRAGISARTVVIRCFPLLLCVLLVMWGGALTAQPVTAVGTHRVQLVVPPDGDAAVVAKAVAATYAGRLEAPVDADNNVAMTLDDSLLELLARDARVRGVAIVGEARAATPQPVSQPVVVPTGATRRLQTDTTATPWTTGTYAYDGAGNITQMGSDQFTYDLYGRVKKGTAAGQSQEYAYDRYGNLESIKSGATTIPVTASTANNRLVSVNGTPVTYDDAGQVKYVGTSPSYTASFTYDGNGMMTSFGSAGVPSTIYLYTPSDERIASVALNGQNEGNSTWTFRDASGKVLRRFDKRYLSNQWTWTWRQDYIYNGSQMLVSENDTSPKTLHYFTDHLGSPRLITDQGGMEMGRAAYLPFGAPALAGIADSKKFTGHERDASGLDYMHARYYNWGWGRFLSVDPVLDLKQAMKNRQGWNRYSYVRNNPLTFTDPTGRQVACANHPQDCKAQELPPPPPPPPADKKGTLSVGVSASGSAVAISGSVNASVSVDRTGEVAGSVTGGAGPTTGGTGASAGATVMVTNATSVTSLSGRGTSGGVSAGAGPGVTVDHVRGPQGNGQYEGVAVTVGPGVKTPEGHYQFTYTWMVTGSQVKQALTDWYARTEQAAQNWVNESLPNLDQ
jgi:RHS repeat-associated protein